MLERKSMKFGTVALVGRSNVGKSTFLNAVLGEPLAIVSPLPQTTRDALLGVAHRGSAQIAFLDTPGLHRQRSELGRRMNAAALEAARATDLLVFMTDVAPLTTRRRALSDEGPLCAEDRALIERLPPGTPTIAVINKVDLLRDKSRLLPLLEALSGLSRFEALVPISVLGEDGVDRVLDEIVDRLPEGPPGYEADTLTDRPASFFIREYIREQILLHTAREVPHAVAVSIERIQQTERLMRISATIHVEKAGQRGVLVGRGGSMLQQIGTAARQRIEALVGQQVHLELYVRVTPRWKNVPRQLAELGYVDAGGAGEDGSAAPAKDDASAQGRRR
jgi:GTPase